ncbi:hypothetical protein [Paraburkholderia youngii]|uniref:hypothetical protein n=1 Tax=Paraburkholderia youngii TaxID=2782701 RepID=UPI003D22B779
MDIDFWLAGVSACGVLGALFGLRVRAASRLGVLLDWWWALAGVILIAALAGELEHVRRLEAQSVAASQLVAAQRTVFADVLQIQERKCSESAFKTKGPVPQFCLTIDAVAREALGGNLQSVEAVALAGELDDSCADRCDSDTVRLSDHLNQYAATIAKVKPLTPAVKADQLARQRLNDNALHVLLCLSLALLCARLTALFRRAVAKPGEDQQKTSAEPRTERTELGSFVFHLRNELTQPPSNYKR